MRRFRYITLIGLILTFGANHHILANQANQLIFTAKTYNPRSVMLARVDINTLIVTPFYIDQDPLVDDLVALAWSPDGTSLAIARYRLVAEQAFTQPRIPQICVVSRQGVLKQCMAESPFIAVNAHFESTTDSIVWSQDGIYISYMALANDKQGIRLIEVDVQTGTTVSVLYNHTIAPLAAIPYLLQYSSNQILVGQMAQPDSSSVTVLQKVTLATTALRIFTNYQSLMPSNKWNRLCPQLSPQKHYAVLMQGIGDITEKMVVINHQGEVVHEIETTPEWTSLRIAACPVWSMDETYIYFGASSETDDRVTVFQYRLADRRLEVRYRIPESVYLPDNEAYGTFRGQLSLSPDGAFLAARSREGISARQQGIVIFPTTGERLLIGDYNEAYAPLWVPPLGE